MELKPLVITTEFLIYDVIMEFIDQTNKILNN